MDVEPDHSVLVDRHGLVQVITINRPQVRNALDASVAAGVAAAVDELDASDELRVGIVTGAGGTFSSGMDLKAFLAGETPVIEGRGLAGIAITPPRKPLIAAVEGWALAAGFELVLACDLVVASSAARFGLPEATRALVAAAGGAVVLPRRVPRAVAMEMLLTGEPIDAARAYEIGLVNRVVAPGEAVSRALELAERIAANGPLAVAASKELVLDSADWSVDEMWERQEPVTARIFESADAKEGATAFAEKRPAVWTGR